LLIAVFEKAGLMPEIRFDADRNLYVPQGGAEDFSAVLILKDPAASTKAASAKR